LDSAIALSLPVIFALIVASPDWSNAMKDAIRYIRVSSEEQAESGLGLEAQRQHIAAYCAMKGLHLAEVFEDPGISAGKPLASRPARSRLLAAAKKGQGRRGRGQTGSTVSQCGRRSQRDRRFRQEGHPAGGHRRIF
jgi:hypothetical protein